MRTVHGEKAAKIIFSGDFTDVKPNFGIKDILTGFLLSYDKSCYHRRSDYSTSRGRTASLKDKSQCGGSHF